MITVTSLKEFLRDIFAPKITIYEWSNMNRKTKDRIKQEHLRMMDEFDKMNKDFRKIFDDL